MRLNNTSRLHQNIDLQKIATGGRGFPCLLFLLDEFLSIKMIKMIFYVVIAVEKFDIVKSTEQTRSGINKARISFTLSASWEKIQFSQEFWWVNSVGVPVVVTRFANWSVPYTYAENYWVSYVAS